MKYEKLRIAWSVGVVLAYPVLVFIAADREWMSPAILFILFYPLLIFSYGIAAAPWVRWRFSVRTLLVVTTIVAVLLGVFIWAAK
jgi:hypothetical protein